MLYIILLLLFLFCCCFIVVVVVVVVASLVISGLWSAMNTFSFLIAMPLHHNRHVSYSPMAKTRIRWVSYLKWVIIIYKDIYTCVVLVRSGVCSNIDP